jgi:hypothetical protein
MPLKSSTIRSASPTYKKGSHSGAASSGPTDYKAPETGNRPEGVGLSGPFREEILRNEAYIEVRRIACPAEKRGKMRAITWRDKWAFFSNLKINIERSFRHEHQLRTRF